MMHQWGDPGVDWRGISDAACFIGSWLRKWGRLPVMDWKEKWGTVRVYTGFGWYQVHCITHPGHHYSRYPQWLWELDCRYGHHLMPPINWLVIPIQERLYRWRYRQALRRWPHLREEILNGADWPELLKGL
jgi:hypothetical protein